MLSSFTDNDSVMGSGGEGEGFGGHEGFPVGGVVVLGLSGAGLASGECLVGGAGFLGAGADEGLIRLNPLILFFVQL